MLIGPARQYLREDWCDIVIATASPRADLAAAEFLTTGGRGMIAERAGGEGGRIARGQDASVSIDEDATTTSSRYRCALATCTIGMRRWP